MIKFGTSIYCVTQKIQSKEWTPPQAIQWLADQGAETIELVPFGIDFFGEPEIIGACLNAADKAEVDISNFSLNANFLQIDSAAYDAEVERVKKYIDVSAKLGVQIGRAHV